VPASVAELIELLELERLDEDLFRGRRAMTDRPRVFGGQVAGQAIKAAALSVGSTFQVHSLHSYFLLPGDAAHPIIYEVERLRDGRSFATRRVVARQHGRPIYFQTASFQQPEAGFTHQDPMPATPGPEQGADLLELAKELSPETAAIWAREWSAVEVRHLGTSAEGLPQNPDHPAQARLWFRVNGALGDNPLQHLAAFTYSSDLTLLGCALVPHGLRLFDPQILAASLDHTIWFHRPFAVDDWWLYDQSSPTAQSGRGLTLGRVFSRDGSLVATVAQEGVIRKRLK
jgi:acyl-CoA thioesterase II